MYIEFKAANGVSVMQPYGTFSLVENDGEFRLYEIQHVDSSWKLTEKEFKRVKQEVRDITELQKKNLNDINVYASVRNE